MSAIASMIDFLLDDFGGCDQKNKASSASVSQHSSMKSCLLLCYAVVTVLVVAMYEICWRPSWRSGWIGFSFVYFIGSCAQCLGLSSLCMKMKATKSAAGISSQSLGLFAASLSCRVFTTTVYDGYLPVDKSGDMWAQMVDGCSLAVVVYMLYSINKTYKHTYQDENDHMSVMPIVVACVASACFIRADLNQDVIFDIIWALGLNFETFQMLPQLAMLAKVGGNVENTTAHYVVNNFIASLCRFSFWVWAVPGCVELAGDSGRYSWDLTLGAYYILGAYSIQALVQIDFMYFYVRARWQGLRSVRLPTPGEAEFV